MANGSGTLEDYSLHHLKVESLSPFIRQKMMKKNSSDGWGWLNSVRIIAKSSQGLSLTTTAAAWSEKGTDNEE